MFDNRESHIFDSITSAENLLCAWREFAAGKRNKKDVQDFQSRLMDNILELHRQLVSGQYRHSPYEAFRIADPKPRDIHKATVRDRLVHHAIYRIIYPYFDKRFIADSYSCRLGKGAHRAMDRFRAFFYRVSRNNTRTCWVLKCDIRKFFASVDHSLLLGILRQQCDDKTFALITNVIDSFSITPGKGLPLGNLTSQLFCNIYMNEFDQFAKHQLKVEHYIRYTDDFVFLSPDQKHLEQILPLIKDFLQEKLTLQLHPDKVKIQTFASGVDFLGWKHFPHHRTLRTASKKRMIRTLAKGRTPERIASYKGMLIHGNAYKLSTRYLYP